MLRCCKLKTTGVQPIAAATQLSVGDTACREKKEASSRVYLTRPAQDPSVPSHSLAKAAAFQFIRATYISNYTGWVLVRLLLNGFDCMMFSRLASAMSMRSSIDNELIAFLSHPSVLFHPPPGRGGPPHPPSA